MNSTLKTYIDNGYTSGLYAQIYFQNVSGYLVQLGNHIKAQDWTNAEIACDNVANSIEGASNYLLNDSSPTYGLRYWWKLALYWIGNNWPSGGEVTMDSILSVMTTASFAQLQKFIGLEDAYRVALWNAPFNAEFYAALARGFQTWP